MDIQRKAFESSNNVNPDWSFKFDEELQQYIATDFEMTNQVDEFNEHWDTFRAGWQAAKAQAVPEWISVKDNLPPENILVLGMSQTPRNIFNIYNVMALDEFEEADVTHWMPLPDAPQEPAND